MRNPEKGNTIKRKIPRSQPSPKTTIPECTQVVLKVPFDLDNLG
jgi:hypothetical protein